MPFGKVQSGLLFVSGDSIHLFLIAFSKIVKKRTKKTFGWKHRKFEIGISLRTLLLPIITNQQWMENGINLHFLFTHFHKTCSKMSIHLDGNLTFFFIQCIYWFCLFCLFLTPYISSLCFPFLTGDPCVWNPPVDVFHPACCHWKVTLNHLFSTHGEL